MKKKALHPRVGVGHWRKRVSGIPGLSGGAHSNPGLLAPRKWPPRT